MRDDEREEEDTLLPLELDRFVFELFLGLYDDDDFLFFDEPETFLLPPEFELPDFFVLLVLTIFTF